LRDKTTEFRGRYLAGEQLDDLLPEAFAAVREAAKRTLGQRHFDVQLLGGIVLHQGKIAEMKTGEGKTLVATLPAYLNGLTGQGVQRALNYAIVDEVDNILIDEARTPLIISGPAEETPEMYYRFARAVTRLRPEEDYTVDEKMRAVSLSDAGIHKMEQLLGVDNLYAEGNFMLAHHLEQAVKAQVLFKRDRDYIVEDGQVIIIDEFTGRKVFGRRFSEGLHQALEAKENVKIERENVTQATITYQNYFRLYKKLAGMTGTAETEAEEMHKIYKLDVVVIPTNEPMIRDDEADLVFM